jgi:hypothetical protein
MNWNMALFQMLETQQLSAELHHSIIPNARMSTSVC